MQAFRSAFRDKDSRKELDVRSESDERVIAGRRTTPRNTLNEIVLKQELANDMAALLNTINLEAIEDLSDLDDVRSSILNYGIDDLNSMSAESQMIDKLAPRLEKVLQTFEGRLVDGTLSVTQQADTDDVNTRVSFHVSAQMHATPADIPVEFVADIEAYSGKTQIRQS